MRVCHQRCVAKGVELQSNARVLIQRWILDVDSKTTRTSNKDSSESERRQRHAPTHMRRSAADPRGWDVTTKNRPTTPLHSLPLRVYNFLCSLR